MGVEGVNDGAQHTALWGAGVECKVEERWGPRAVG